MHDLENLHSKPLPQGWSEHFDTERKIWYYVDLDSIPPRASLVHPADNISQGHDQSGGASILSRPLPIINATNSCDNVQTNGTTLTSAQRLYATATISNSSGLASTSVATPEVSIRQHASISARSIVVDTSLSPTQTPSPTSVTANLEDSPSRYRPRRLRQSRQMTHPFLSPSPFSTPLSVAQGSTGQTLYNPAVQISASGPNFDSKSRPKPQGPKVLREASLVTSHTEGLDFRRKALPPIPADRERSNGLTTAPTTSNSQHRNVYSGITEDNVLLMPAHGKVSSPGQRAIIDDDEVSESLPPLSPTRCESHQPIVSTSFSQSMDQVIFQPRPIKPLRGLSANFQDQIRETSQPTPSLEEDQHKNVAKKVKRFSLDLIKSGKSEPDKDNHRSSLRYDDDSSWTPILNSSLDESFVLVNDAHL
ncbi:hypothetical protein BYT27DRAFT_7256196 [Phlegmacium glaucopus]|nr:hypothetical protein BYT27DRAFT_7256196 [Phlegmacium glaucopus]